jgi:predicted HD phosphohydrolase
MNKVAARLSTDTDAEAVIRKYGAPSPQDAAQARAFDEAVADAAQQLPALMPAGARQ